MGFGQTRFAGPSGAFKLLYLARDLPSSIAEAIVRDRFEGVMPREMVEEDFTGWGACAVDADAPLKVLDLRRDGCFRLDISTDIVGAKAQEQARAFSEVLHQTTDLDGIRYYSRLRRKECLAVYARAVAGQLVASSVVPLAELASLIPALKSLKIKLI